MELSSYYNTFYDSGNQKNKNTQSSRFFDYVIGKQDVDSIYKSVIEKKHGNDEMNQLYFESYTGLERDRDIPRKREIGNLFENDERVAGIVKKIPREEIFDRYNTTTRKQDSRVTDPLRVNRGLGKNVEDNSQTGIHPMYRATPKNIDDLRSKNDQRKKVFENAPIVEGKKESRGGIYLTNDNLTRVSRKLIQKAVDLVKSRAVSTAPKKTGEINLKKEDPKKMYQSSAALSSKGFVVPGVFEPPRSTRLAEATGTSRVNKISSGHGVRDNRAPDTTNRVIDETNPIHDSMNVRTRNMFHQKNQDVPESLMRELDAVNSFGTKSLINPVVKGHDSNVYVAPKTNIREVDVTENTMLESGPVVTKKGVVNHGIGAPDTSMREISHTRESHKININPVVNEFRVITEKNPELTIKEISIDDVYVNHASDSLMGGSGRIGVEKPDWTQSNISADASTTHLRAHDASGMGYSSNVKEAGITGRETVLPDSFTQGTAFQYTSGKTINDTDVRDTQRQNDSDNQVVGNATGGVFSMNNRQRDKDSVQTTGCKNVIEEGVSRRGPTKKSVVVTPSKSIIGDVELRDPVHSSRMLVGSRVTKNQSDTVFLYPTT